MTWWIVRADYRPLSEHSPRYAFVSDAGRTAREVAAEFRRRYSQLSNVQVRELTEEEMAAEPIRKWVMWI